MKRRIALLQTLSRISDAVDALVELLDASPTDIEAWAELGELYLSQGHFSQAKFCLEEILLVAPNAWNVGDSFIHLKPPETVRLIFPLRRYTLAWGRCFICQRQAVTRAAMKKSCPNPCGVSAGVSSCATVTSEVIMG